MVCQVNFVPDMMFDSSSSPWTSAAGHERTINGKARSKRPGQAGTRQMVPPENGGRIKRGSMAGKLAPSRSAKQMADKSAGREVPPSLLAQCQDVMKGLFFAWGFG